MTKTQSASRRLPSLNALPAFSAAARLCSISLAARELCVTPGAISRQIKSLEESLGSQLFRRGHNSIVLTEAGHRFLAHVNGALAMLQTGASTIVPDRSHLSIRAPITLARRWLIPRIRSFCQENPGVDIAIHSLALGDAAAADITMTYVRATDTTALSQAFLLDRTMAVCSPQLLALRGRSLAPAELLGLPLLLDTGDAWSWRRWCAAAGTGFHPRGGSITLDTDEASIDACLSGLGVGQASPSFIEKELRSGQLVALCADVAPIVGAYSFAHAPKSLLAGQFVSWLQTQNDTAKAAFDIVAA
ncbi:Transcriptional regulator, LysR family [Devosia sp. LC5]|uniref:LysR substrate-binding domain-containing protein n=1 Tax=Devosia sp. LC5 TaxID=1502724 RepID=UPI0004E36158|nr:LysR substrate-binding domain-containing protein [Devosia sp. LC5]KFC67187.1 Transcriptional regulator, LysR family [Devosia sp. LC5]